MKHQYAGLKCATCIVGGGSPVPTYTRWRQVHWLNSGAQGSWLLNLWCPLIRFAVGTLAIGVGVC